VSVCVCVCVCVCVSVTLWYNIKPAESRIMQIMPHDSPRTLVFLLPKITAKVKFELNNLLPGATNASGVG